jgi:regulator of protease activity HflC (stomatin/prohibitin superfamily)
LQPGLGVICCPIDQLVGKLSFRVQHLHVKVETKTLDNVFLVAVVSVKYQVFRDKMYEAFYALTNPAQQITAHVCDVMRSQLPILELDAVLKAKEEVTLAVKNALDVIMMPYGYQMIQVLITDLCFALPSTNGESVHWCKWDHKAPGQSNKTLMSRLLC